jgi:O-acetyl-ADP-ribose deacetylase
VSNFKSTPSDSEYQIKWIRAGYGILRKGAKWICSLERIYSHGEHDRSLFMPQLIAIQGDITKTSVDAIVNAANSSLLGGGGVDGAIHRAAGPELLAACEKLRGCETGNAKATSAFRLPAKWVFHAVGPVWHGGRSGEDELLAACYARCMQLARKHQARSIAFPAISTGVYRFPPERAARIAVGTVRAHLNDSGVDEVHFVCFDRETLSIYRQLIADDAQQSAE